MPNQDCEKCDNRYNNDKFPACPYCSSVKKKTKVDETAFGKKMKDLKARLKPKTSNR